MIYQGKKKREPSNFIHIRIHRAEARPSSYVPYSPQICHPHNEGVEDKDGGE